MDIDLGVIPDSHKGEFRSGWYRHIGSCGCVSRNFRDRKWRIVCDPRPFEVQPTFRTRDDAARGEWLFVKGLVEAASW
jgi:hypothetical protein